MPSPREDIPVPRVLSSRIPSTCAGRGDRCWNTLLRFGNRSISEGRPSRRSFLARFSWKCLRSRPTTLYHRSLRMGSRGGRGKRRRLPHAGLRRTEKTPASLQAGRCLCRGDPTGTLGPVGVGIEIVGVSSTSAPWAGSRSVNGLALGGAWTELRLRMHPAVCSTDRWRTQACEQWQAGERQAARR